MSAHAQFKVEPGIPVFFADPQSFWQRGTNENTSGLFKPGRALRQHFDGVSEAGLLADGNLTDYSQGTTERARLAPVTS